MSLAAVGVLTLMLVGAPATIPHDRARQVAQSELSRSEYQTQLPGEDPLAKPAEHDLAGSDARRDARVAVPLPSALANIAGVLLWLLIIVAGLVLVVWLLRELLGFSAAPPLAIADGAEKAAAMRAVVARPLADAEGLAAEGRFGEAIHVLLLRTLQALVERGRLDLPASLTSREVVAHVRLPADADAALRGLVSAVEISHFGGETPGAAEWQTCLGQFQHFARAYGGAA